MIAWLDATTLLMRMVGAMIDAGVVPARLVTSSEILTMSGWMKTASLADDGSVHLLGMTVVETAMPVLHVDCETARTYLDDGESRVHAVYRHGTLYLGVGS